MNATHNLAICIATYMRPERLPNLLTSLRVNDLEGVGACVLVVDNDPLGSAEESALLFASDYPVTISYFVEPIPGISAARNKLISEARDLGVGWIVFVDDDEIVSDEWLVSLVDAAGKYGADIVLGPVDPIYPVDAPDWVVRGNLLGRPHYRSGTQLKVFNTGNVLIRLSLLDEMAHPFELGFGITGGSDTMLSMYLAKLGARIVWCEEATTWEPVDIGRLSVSWIMKRAYRGGSVYQRVQQTLSPGLHTRVRGALSGGGRVVQAMVAIPVSLRGGRAEVVHHMSLCCRGVGRIAAALELDRFQEYRRPKAK